MDEKIYVTNKGLQELKERLAYLKTVARQEVTE